MTFDLTPLTQEELDVILATAPVRKDPVVSVHHEFVAGDICKLASSVPGSKGRRYSYLSTASNAYGEVTHVELRDVKSGNTRSVRPEVVSLDVKATAALRHREANK